MALNKNFVVKNGFEVNTDLILADATTNKVGIGSTGPRYKLDVAGGIGATDFYLSGVGTFANELNVGTDGSVLTVLGIGGSVGIATANPSYLLDVRSPVSTGVTALYVQGDVRITGDVGVDDITLDQATVNYLNVTGFSTLSDLLIPDGGSLTSPVGVITSITSTNINVSGIATLGTVQVSSGVVSATTGIITYYGDGSNLTGIATGLTGTIGVGSESTFVGSGVSEIYFATTTGTNVNVVAAGTSATVTITPGVSLGLAIALGG